MRSSVFFDLTRHHRLVRFEQSSTSDIRANLRGGLLGVLDTPLCLPNCGCVGLTGTSNPLGRRVCDIWSILDEIIVIPS